MEKLITFNVEEFENELKEENDKVDKVNSLKEPALFYINQDIKLGDISLYEVNAKIGRGRFSEVYAGRNKINDNKIVIKILKPISNNKIKREILVLKYLKDCPNSIHLIDITKGESSDIYCLIYNNISGYELKSMSINITPDDLKLYIYKILQCLSFCHSKNIMHRDIKPGNIVVNNLTKELNVIDWGISEYYIDNYIYNTRVGTIYFKAPELLLEYKKYNYAIDIWGVGCIFGAILFQKDILFKGKNLNEQLTKIVEVFGYQEIENFWKKYKDEIKMNEIILEKMKKYEKKEWGTFINSNNKYLITDDAIDLLDKLLKFDFKERITAQEALKHKYFNDLKLENK